MRDDVAAVDGFLDWTQDPFSELAETPQDGPQSGPMFTYSTPEQPFWRRTLIRAVERLSGRAGFERLYAEWRAGPRDGGETVFTSAIAALEVEPVVPETEMARIPAEGPLLVVANHPYGIIDGLLIGHLISTRRSDVKLICHSLLCQPREARDVLLPIDFGAGPEARRTSAETRKRAQTWLDQGHALIIFPGGGVATSRRPLRGPAVDLAWHPFVARLAKRAGVKTLAIFVHGQNSRLFQVVSHLSYPLRVALIFFETRRRMAGPVNVSIAEPVELAAVGKADMMAVLRARTYAMAGAGGPVGVEEFAFPKFIRF